MNNRCLNPKNRAFERYGGRGITICKRWISDKYGFENFLKDMGEKSEGMEIHRKDNNGNYEKNNCIWINRIEHRHLRNRK